MRYNNRSFYVLGLVRIMILYKNFKRQSLLLWGLLIFTTLLHAAAPRSANIVKLTPDEVVNVFNSLEPPTKKFNKAAAQSISYYRTLSDNKVFNYGSVSYSPHEMIRSIQLFQCLAKNVNSRADLRDKLIQYFDVYETKNNYGSALITGYYAPIYEGSLTRSDEFPYGLYEPPKAMNQARVKVRYFPRQVIEENPENLLRPIIYLRNRLDQYFTHVQGSAIIRVRETDQLLHVGYHTDNGYKYTPIGKILIDENKIERENMSLQAIRRYVENNPQELERLINTESSFVFFKVKKQGAPLGNIGRPLTGWASVAMDHRLIPRGGMVYLKTTVPDINYKDSDIPKKDMPHVPFESFMFTQDTGGAIRGGGRVDVYFGEGEDAAFYAGLMSQFGRVLLIVAKKEALFQTPCL